MTTATAIAADQHELEVERAIAEAIAAEIDAELLDEPLGAGYDEGLVLVHEP